LTFSSRGRRGTTAVELSEEKGDSQEREAQGGDHWSIRPRNACLFRIRLLTPLRQRWELGREDYSLSVSEKKIRQKGRALRVECALPEVITFRELSGVIGGGGIGGGGSRKKREVSRNEGRI